MVKGCVYTIQHVHCEKKYCFMFVVCLWAMLCINLLPKHMLLSHDYYWEPGTLLMANYATLPWAYKVTHFYKGRHDTVTPDEKMLFLFETRQQGSLFHLVIIFQHQVSARDGLLLSARLLDCRRWWWWLEREREKIFHTKMDYLGIHLYMLLPCVHITLQCSTLVCIRAIYPSSISVFPFFPSIFPYLFYAPATEKNGR